MPYFTLRLLGPYAALTRTRRPTAAMSHIDSSRVSAISNVIAAISTWPKTATVNNICSIVSIYLMPRGNGGGAQSGSAALMNRCRVGYAASWEALSVAMGSASFEERGGAACGLQSLTNPASHEACRSALNSTFRYSGVSLSPR
jgi:hypothetical protein